jgi:hypothetical protein
VISHAFYYNSFGAMGFITAASIALFNFPAGGGTIGFVTGPILMGLAFFTQTKWWPPAKISN